MRTNTSAPSNNRFGRNRVALLVLANFLASVGGGRVLSATKGLTGLKVLGSGSLLALLVGSVISLYVLRLARRVPGGRSLVGVSAASAACSAGLLLIYRTAATGTGTTVTTPVAGGALLSGGLAWLFFSGLVLRCAMWFAGRSLRTGLVSSVSKPGLALSEAAYFGGLVAGLLIGLPALFRGDVVVSAFTLDIALLALAACLDYSSTKKAASLPPGGVTGQLRTGLPAHIFVKLTSAYATATIGCQIVVFQLADVLARSPSAAARAWADPSLAAFYVGVAAMAVAASGIRPGLATDPLGRPVIVRRRADEPAQAAIPAATLCLLAGAMIVAGVLVLYALVGSRTSGAAETPFLALIALTAIAAGAGLFEVFALAVLASLSAGGQQSVALALGAAAAAATIAMLLMLLAGPRPAVWAGVNALGLVVAVSLVRRALVPAGAQADRQ